MKKSVKNKIKAILFDYDGTLVDTERIAAIIYPKVFEKFGFNFNRENALKIRSLGTKFRAEFLSKILKVKITEKEYLKAEKVFLKYFDKYIKKNGIKTKPYCVETLHYLKKKNIPIIIVSCTKKDRIEKQLKKLNLLEYFDDIISTDFVENGKPCPDVYIAAAKTIGLDTKNCLAIEDSPNGIMSACNAGCQTIMIPDLTQPDKQLLNKHKFKVLKNLKELEKFI